MDCRKIEAARVGGLVAITTFQARTSGSSRSASERISLCWKRIGRSFSRRCNHSSIRHAGTDDGLH